MLNCYYCRFHLISTFLISTKMRRTLMNEMIVSSKPPKTAKFMSKILTQFWLCLFLTARQNTSLKEVGPSGVQKLLSIIKAYNLIFFFWLYLIKGCFFFLSFLSFFLLLLLFFIFKLDKKCYVLTRPIILLDGPAILLLKVCHFFPCWFYSSVFFFFFYFIF